jgi:hypothetical protein
VKLENLVRRLLSAVLLSNRESCNSVSFIWLPEKCIFNSCFSLCFSERDCPQTVYRNSLLLRRNRPNCAHQ